MSTLHELDEAMLSNNKDLIDLTERKATQQSKVRRLEAKAEMYSLLKQKAQEAINLVGIFHPVFRSKTKVMITSADVQGSYYTKQTEIAKQELKNVTDQVNEIKGGKTFAELPKKKRAIQGSKVAVNGGVINFSDPKNARLLQNLFDVKGDPTCNFKRLTQLCVDYPKSTATIPKSVLREIKRHANEMLLTIELYKLFGKKQKSQTQEQPNKNKDERAEKMKALEDTSGLSENNEEIKTDNAKKITTNPTSADASDGTTEDIGNLF